MHAYVTPPNAWTDSQHSNGRIKCTRLAWLLCISTFSCKPLRNHGGQRESAHKICFIAVFSVNLLSCDKWSKNPSRDLIEWKKLAGAQSSLPQYNWPHLFLLDACRPFPLRKCTCCSSTRISNILWCINKSWHIVDAMAISPLSSFI